MARAHLFRPVTDEKGNLLYGAQVTVRKTDINALLGQAIYAGPLSGATVLDNPFIIDGGYVDIWLDTPERVNLYIESAGRDPISIYLDVNTPADEVLRSLYPLTITNQAATDKVLVGVDESTASWQDAPAVEVGVVPAHDHDGVGANSTALGTGASAPASGSTAIGDTAVASGTDSVAFGADAAATGAGTVAVGVESDASGIGGVAVGQGAQAVDGAAAIGHGAAASGANAGAIGKSAQALGAGSVALGLNAVAIGPDAVAVGGSANASGEDSVAVGQGAAATHARSAALGNGAATTGDDQVALGAAGSTTVVVGDLIALANARLAGAASSLGFFGAVGTTKVTITGVVDDPILFTLLEFLDSIGLITNDATEAP